MKRKMPNAAHVWKQLDDFVVPNLRLNVIDRAVYSHLLRHTRLECRHRLCFSQLWLAKASVFAVTPLVLPCVAWSIGAQFA